MDSDLTRLCAIPGTHDLSQTEAAEVLQVSVSYIQRAIAKGFIQVKRLQARGQHAHRCRIPRASIVRYLADMSTGDKSVILACIAAQCPQWLCAAQGLPQTQPPSNVIQLSDHTGRKPRKQGPTAEHPDQLQLFSA